MAFGDAQMCECRVLITEECIRVRKSLNTVASRAGYAQIAAQGSFNHESCDRALAHPPGLVGAIWLQYFGSPSNTAAEYSIADAS